MEVLVIHQNFPGQFAHQVRAWCQRRGWEVRGLGRDVLREGRVSGFASGASVRMVLQRRGRRCPDHHHTWFLISLKNYLELTLTGSTIHLFEIIHQ